MRTCEPACGAETAARTRGGVSQRSGWQEVSVAKEDRGFASMDRAKQREIASKGGKAAHQKGTAHEWTSEEAREAGRKGGMASHRRRKEMGDEQGDATQARPEAADDTERSAATIRASRFASVSSVLAVFISSGPARVAPGRFLLVYRYIGSSCLAHDSATDTTGRSFNGRTRRSGRRYRGSNPCLPANFASSCVFPNVFWHPLVRTVG